MRPALRAGRMPVSGMWHPWLLTALTAVLATTGCKDGGSTEPEPTPTMTIALSASAVSVVQGQSGTVTANITRGGGFTGAVALTLEGAPTGVTGAFVPASLGAGVTASTLTLNVAASAAVGSSALTVRATGAGVSAQTATLNLTVSVPPSIGIATTVTAPSVMQGATGTVPVTLTRAGGFAGAVRFTLEGAPAGVTGVFAPDSLIGAGAATTLTLTVAAGAAPGAYNLTLRARGTGVADQTIPITLTVVAAVPAQGFTLALAPAALTVPQGAAGNTLLTAARTGGFAGAVTLSAAGAPAGVTVDFATTDLTGDTVTLSVAVAALGSAGGAPVPGTYDITVTGQATGLTAQTVVLALTVSAGPGGYTLALSPAAVSVQAGANGRAAVRIARTAGFAGAVTLALSGAPAELAATLGETTTLADSVELSLAVGAAVAPGTYPITVTGSVAGLATDQTAMLDVTVTQAPAGGFTLTLTPASVSVAQGGNTTSAVTIGRTGGFAGAVALTVTGAPAGLTATLDSASVGGAGTTIRLTATGGLATGNYLLTVRGTGTGVPEQTVTLTVVVTGPPGGNVTFAFCPGAEPLFFAFQNGTAGAWTRVTGMNGQFSFTIDDRGGVAYADATDMTVFYATADELRSIGSNGCLGEDPTIGGKTLTGSVAGLGLTDQASITMGSASAAAGGMQPTFTLNNVPDGALDLVAARLLFDLGTFKLSADKFIIRRGLNLANNAVIPVLDFGAAEAFDPVTSNLTISNLGTETGSLGLGFFTAANAGSLGFGTGSFYYFDGQRDAAGTYPGIPANQQVAGDLHLLIAYASTGTVPTRGQIAYFSAAADRTITLGAPLSTPTVSVLASAPYLRLRVELPAQAEYDDAVTATFTQTGRAASITATPGYFSAGFSTWDFSIPDLTAIGFLAAWGLPAAATDYNLNASGYTGVTGVPSSPVDGVVVQFASRSGTVTP